MSAEAERNAVTVRAMTAADWPAVVAIYGEGIAGGNATFETAVPVWEAWDASHHPHSRFVAAAGGELIGWAALSPVSRREVYAGVAEASVYVASAWTRRGVGSTLLRTLIASSEAHGIWTLQGSLFPENEASLALLRAHGFRIVGRRERIARHHGRWRDTILVERRSGRLGA